MPWNYARDRYNDLFPISFKVKDMKRNWLRLEKVNRSIPDVVGPFKFASFLLMKRIWLDLWKKLASNLTRVLDRVIYFNIYPPPPGLN